MGFVGMFEQEHFKAKIDISNFLFSEYATKYKNSNCYQ